MQKDLKILTVVGARPQFVKAAVVSREIRNRPGVAEVIVHTGQHFDHNMSEVFFNEMDIPRPHYQLGVNSLEHGAMTGRMLERIEEVVLEEKPDRVVVYGDTNSTLAGALAAKKLHVDVAHVEAGLRSFNMRMPEEINRILTDRISDVLCCPTENAVTNLKREGFDEFDCRIVNTGDVMKDAALYYGELSPSRSTLTDRLSLRGVDFALCTIHRAENTDDRSRLESIVRSLNELAEEMRVVMPLHPRTRGMLAAAGMKLEVTALDPVGYFDMIELIKWSRIVLTDSGGLQKEAYVFGRPCVTLRDETEWVELVECGANVVVGSDRDRIVEGYRRMLKCGPAFTRDLYGDGHAGRLVLEAIVG